MTRRENRLVSDGHDMRRVFNKKYRQKVCVVVSRCCCAAQQQQPQQQQSLTTTNVLKA